MAKILYVYNDQVYANITNKCDCNCTFCIRKQFDGVGDADTLWHKAEPSLSEIIAAIDAFDFTGYKEFVFCGYGEPTCALENLIASARYVKEKTSDLVPCGDRAGRAPKVGAPGHSLDHPRRDFSIPLLSG